MATHSHIFGLHAVIAALQQNHTIKTVLVLQDRHDPKMQKLLKLAENQGIEIRTETRKTLDTYAKSHQGVVALCEEPAESSSSLQLEDLLEAALHKHQLLLVLDGITDPHNLGACIRSAEALGADGVIVPKDKSASVTAVVHKTSAGASQILPILTATNLAEALKKCKAAGFWIVGLEGSSDVAIQEIDLTVPTVIVMGSEGSGLRRLTKEHCDFLAQIPMLGQTESLNVSVACGISLFAVLQQRLLQKR